MAMTDTLRRRGHRPRRLLALTAIWTAATAAGGVPAADRSGHPSPDLDLTARYESYLEDGGFDRARVEAAFAKALPLLREMRVLVAPSWLSDTARAASERGLFDYLGDQIETLRRAGIAVEIAATDSEESVAVNGPIILRQIAASDRPLCIISHSKGGLDALDALIRADPETLEKVRCWVALQSPFAGSPTADLAQGNWLVRNAASELLPALGGSAQSLVDLTVAERRRYLGRHAAQIDRLLGRIQVLCYAGRVEDVALESFLAGIGARIIDWASARRLPSDGLVPVESAILPDSHYIVARGVDHAIVVTDRNPLAPPFDRLLLIKLLLSLVLSLPESPPQKA